MAVWDWLTPAPAFRGMVRGGGGSGHRESKSLIPSPDKGQGLGRWGTGPSSSSAVLYPCRWAHACPVVLPPFFVRGGGGGSGECFRALERRSSERGRLGPCRISIAILTLISRYIRFHTQCSSHFTGKKLRLREEE